VELVGAGAGGHAVTLSRFGRLSPPQEPQVEDEPPDEPPEVDPVDEPPVVELPDEVLPDDESLELTDGMSFFAAAAPPPELEYRSEYQPPPLRMKPVPREICRLASAALHFGQSRSGSSLMLCSASHSWPQEPHAYS
jgi:hypothetical protein